MKAGPSLSQYQDKVKQYLSRLMDGCWVQAFSDSEFTVSADMMRKTKRVYIHVISVGNGRKNIYDQALYNKFVSGYFFYE